MSPAAQVYIHVLHTDWVTNLYQKCIEIFTNFNNSQQCSALCCWLGILAYNKLLPHRFPKVTFEDPPNLK